MWKDPRHDYRLSTLLEGKAMIDIGLPLRFVATQLGLTPSEQTTVLAMIEEDKVEAEAKEQAQLDAQAAQNETPPVAETDTPSSV